MPNWCSNYIKIEGPKELIEKFAKAFSEGSFLNSICPQPEYENPDDWYNWCCNNWGTKWDISSHDVDVCRSDEDIYYFEEYFQSAWGPPTEAYTFAVKNNKDLRIIAYYYESGCCFAGSYEGGFEDDIILDEAFTLDSEIHDYSYFASDSFGKVLDEHFDILEDIIESWEWDAGEDAILIVEED